MMSSSQKNKAQLARSGAELGGRRRRCFLEFRPQIPGRISSIYTRKRVRCDWAVWTRREGLGTTRWTAESPEPKAGFRSA